MSENKDFSMDGALKTLGTGPALIKLRQRTSTPLSVSNDAKPTIVEEHITLQATSWREFGGAPGLWKLTLVDGMDVVISSSDIFAIFTKSSGVH
jgi:hypothetical protein